MHFSYVERYSASTTFPAKAGCFYIETKLLRRDRPGGQRFASKLSAAVSNVGKHDEE